MIIRFTGSLWSYIKSTNVGHEMPVGSTAASAVAQRLYLVLNGSCTDDLVDPPARPPPLHTSCSVTLLNLTSTTDMLLNVPTIAKSPVCVDYVDQCLPWSEGIIFGLPTKMHDDRNSAVNRSVEEEVIMYKCIQDSGFIDDPSDRDVSTYINVQYKRRQLPVRL